MKMPSGGKRRESHFHQRHQACRPDRPALAARLGLAWFGLACITSESVPTLFKPGRLGEKESASACVCDFLRAIKSDGKSWIKRKRG